MIDKQFKRVADLLQKIKAFDDGLYQHSIDVAYIASLVGSELGCSRDECLELWIAGALHDFGKLFITPSILNKPSYLTPFEYSIVKCHVVIGYNVLAESGRLSDECLLGVLEHHERSNGQGYPFKKNGATLIGQIVAISDVYNALVAVRPYKIGLSKVDTFRIIRQQGLFEEVLIDALEKAVSRFNDSTTGIHVFGRSKSSS